MTEGRKQNRNKSKSWKISEIKYKHTITCWNCNKKGHFQNQCLKLVASKDKEVNMEAINSNDALVCCVKNTVEDRIIDSGSSFHATYCKEESERFKIRSGKVVWEAEESFFYNASEDKETAETAAEVAFCVENGIVMLKMVLETPLQFGVAERLSRTFRAESTGICVEAPKMLWADSVSTTYLIYRIPYVSIGLPIPEEEWRGNDTSLAHLKVIQSRDITFVDSIYGARSVTDSSSLMKPIQKIQVVLVDIPNNLAENDSIVAEHEVKNTLKTEHPPRREAPRLHKYEDPPESRAPVRYSPSVNYLLITENGEPDSYSKALSSKESVQLKKVIIKEIISLKMNEACFLVRLSAGKNASQSLWMFMVKEEQCGKLEGGVE
ncbi:retrovirus-related pol polyprotein from transposon TNT 1-94 [Tanacetum coccineum]